jgi:hypothetical protein
MIPIGIVSFFFPVLQLLDKKMTFFFIPGQRNCYLETGAIAVKKETCYSENKLYFPGTA